MNENKQRNGQQAGPSDAEWQELRTELDRLRQENRMILESIDEMLVSIDVANFTVLRISPACEKILGYRPEELMDKLASWREYVHPDDQRLLDMHLRDLVHDKPLKLQCRLIHRSGEVVWVEARCMAVYSSEGELIGINGVARDISKTKKAGKALMESEFLFRQFFDNAHEAILVSDARTGFFCDYNDTALKLFGYSGSELLTMTPADLSPEHQPDGRRSIEGVQDHLRRTLDGERPVFEWVSLTADGRQIPCEIRLHLTSVSGRHLVRASILDITGRRKAEEEVRALNESLERKVIERTAELSEANAHLEAFSYTVSHDLQSPLRVISGYCQVVLDEYSDRLDESGREMLRTIDHSTLRMSELIKDLLKFAKVGRADCVKEKVDMDLIVHSVVHEIRRDMPDMTAEIRIDDLHRANCDPGLIRQVWINLLSNAVKYSSRKESPLIIVSSSRDHAKVTYQVRDNGVGFDMRYAKKLFSVFSRMHSESEFEGTGVGLATVQTIVSRHGGRVWAEAAPGVGATFYFSLPE